MLQWVPQVNNTMSKCHATVWNPLQAIMPWDSNYLMNSMAVKDDCFLFCVHLMLWEIHAENLDKMMTALLIFLPLFVWETILSAGYYHCYPWLGLNHSKYKWLVTFSATACNFERKWVNPTQRSQHDTDLSRELLAAILLNTMISLGQKIHIFQ